MNILPYLKRAWHWCKVNWKFLVGFAIPFVIMFFLDQRRARKVLEKGIEFRKKELDVVQRASDLESARVKRNAEDFAERVEEVNTRHEEAFRRLHDNSEVKRDKLGGSDAAELTGIIADKFNVVLVHKPLIWDQIYSNCDLMLSGHTHNCLLYTSDAADE